MRKFSTHDRDLLAPLSVPIVLVPFLSSWISALVLGWSLCVLLFTVWRLMGSASRSHSPVEQRGQETHSVRWLWSFALATTALQLVPVLWIGTLWALQGGTRGVLLFGFSRRALLWVQSSNLVAVFFWLILFFLVAVLLRITQRVHAWHHDATRSAFSTFDRLNPAPLRLPDHFTIEERHSRAD